MDGDIEACPFCETFRLHLPGHCSQRNSFYEDDIWDLFVVKRAGKSQVRTGDRNLMWSNLVKWRWNDNPEEEQLPMYPHSREFAAERLHTNLERWRTHDYSLEPLGLAPDPRTEDMEKLMDDLALFRPYDADPQATARQGMDGYLGT